MSWIEGYQTYGATIAYAICLAMGVRWMLRRVFGRRPLIGLEPRLFSDAGWTIIGAAAVSVAVTLLVLAWER